MDEPRPDVSRLSIDRSRPAGGGRALPLALLVLLLAVAAWWVLEGRARVADGAEVQVGRVLSRGGAAARSGLSANGYVVARRRAALSTDVQGRLVEVRVEEGDAVRAGDVIARLDTSQLEAGRQRARADVARAEAAADLAGLEHERLIPLTAMGDATQAALDVARAARQEAQATLASLRAAVDEIDVLIAKSEVRAPFDGVITRKDAEVGEVVSSIGATGPNARGSVATLVDFASLEVQVELAQTSLQGVQPGAPVLVYLDPWPEHAYRGRVRQVWPQADRQKGTVELRIEFLERDERVLPEMSLRAVFVAEDEATPTPPEVLVPAAALAGPDGPRRHVFLVAEGRALRREVVLSGEERAAGRVVSEGLEGGEAVVLHPASSLRDGDPLRLGEADR